MKRQFLLILITIVLNALNTFSQNVEYWIEPTTKKPKGLTQPIILGQYNKNIYAMQAKYSNAFTDNIKLDVYSENLVLQSMTDLLSKDPTAATLQVFGEKRKEEFDNVFMIDNSIYMFTTVFNKDENKFKAYARIFNENGEMIKNLTELDEKQKEKGFWSMGVAKFIYRLSEDRSKIMVIHYPSIKDKYSNERIYFKIYNRELELLKSGDIELPYKDKAMTIQKIMITNDGIIDILASVVVDFKSKVKGEARYFYNISVINPDDPSNINTYEVKLAKEYISDITISLDSMNNIICCGFYGHEKNVPFTASAIIGTFFIKIDGKTNEYVVQSKKPFDQDFLMEFKRERKVMKGEGLSSFTIRDLVHREDGGVVMIAEQYFVITYQSYNSSTGTWSTHYEYHYEDIIVINIRPDGEIDWYTRIPKHQVSSGNTQFFSYALAVVKDKMYFIYLDNPKNMAFKSSKNMKIFNNPKSAVAILATVSNDGSVKKEQIFTTKEVKAYLMPGSHIPIDNNELIVNSQLKGNWKLFKFAFKE